MGTVATIILMMLAGASVVLGWVSFELRDVVGLEPIARKSSNLLTASVVAMIICMGLIR